MSLYALLSDYRCSFWLLCSFLFLLMIATVPLIFRPISLHTALLLWPCDPSFWWFFPTGNRAVKSICPRWWHNRKHLFFRHRDIFKDQGLKESVHLPPSSQSHHSPKGVTYENQVDSILGHGFHCAILSLGYHFLLACFVFPCGRSSRCILGYLL